MRNRLSIYAAVAGLCIATLMMGPAFAQHLDGLAARSQLEREVQQHRVMTFYYPWYGLPGGPGIATTNRHWPVFPS